MKNLFQAIVMIATVCCISGTAAQNKKLDKAYDKMYKTKVKEYRSEGWKISGSAKTLEVALLEHYEKLKDDANTELVGECSQGLSINACRQVAYNNALITYANLAGSTLKGRIVSDTNIDQSDMNGEFDKMYAAYERLVQSEIKGVLTESFSVVKENGKKKQYRVYFIVNEEKASQARIRAMQRALEETQAAQKYAREISDFVQEGFANN
ncbi:MAG: hypothetical protein NC250_06565 [Alistipes senegalensis]|nr:hypothetical protein [Alistipes senegalensis]